MKWKICANLYIKIPTFAEYIKNSYKVLSHGDGTKCIKYNNMAYEECFKLAMHEEKTIRDRFLERFPIIFILQEDRIFDADGHYLAVDSCRRMFSNSV